MLFVLLLALVATVSAKSYHGYELLQISTATQHDRDLLTRLRNSIIQLDTWDETPDHIDLFVAPKYLGKVKQFFARHNLAFKVVNDHMQSDIEKERQELAARRAMRGTYVFDVNDFNTLEDINSELNSLAGRCDASLTCTVENAGLSYEGRDMFYLKVTGGTGRQAVFIDSTTHAREWLATATIMKIATHIVDDYPADSQVQYLVDTYDWYFLPVVNPDGYEYTWQSDRVWRKNRSPNDGSNCIGTDLNRNFDQMWSNAGSSNSPCSDTYHGSGPASEPETQNMQAIADSLGSTFLCSFHFHTYGQYWLIPWGSTDVIGCNIADDHDDMMAVADPAADAVEATHNTNWLRGNSCQTIYAASGITMDYFKDLGGVKYTTTPEMRGNGFVVPPSEIQPSYEEIWNGITTAISEIEAHP